jgi:hypothetical protein
MCLALVAIATAAWYLFPSRDDAVRDAPGLAMESTNERAPVPTAPEPIADTEETPSPEPPAPIVKEDDPSVRDLEARFRATKVLQEQTDILKQIAGFSDAAAVECLARLFHQQSHPAVKEALLAALGDIDPREAPDARLQLLATALHGEARNVRLAALDLLDELDDPRGAELIADAMEKDPDRQVRDVAAAMIRERAEDAEP